MKLFLTGYMGSGKTTTGKLLARELSLPFYDLDEQIEMLEKRSVSEIFQKDGEEVFRQLESMMLDHFIQNQEDFVLATGGGTPCFHDNMKKMNRSGITIYLECTTESLQSRLVQDSTSRPLLANIPKDNLKMWIHGKLSERNLFYRQAQATVNAEQEPEQIISEIKFKMTQAGMESSR